MMQIVEETREQKAERFMKMKKRDLVEMLLNNQALVEAWSKMPTKPPEIWPYIPPVTCVQPGIGVRVLNWPWATIGGAVS